MQIGIPKEIKNHEYRIGLTPDKAKILINEGHQVVVQKNAGTSIGYTDEMFACVGAKLVETAKEVYESEMIIKVKEPLSEEFDLLHEGQVIFGYFHLAPDPQQTENLIRKKVIAIAYETVTDNSGGLPLLLPMSEIAGRISIQAGAIALHKAHGGRGVLLGGVPGVAPANVVIIGGGVAGTESARMAMGLGANVTVLDVSLRRLRELDMLYGPLLKTLYSDSSALENILREADLVIGAVLIPGKCAPKLITRDLLKVMKKGSVLVDISIDQGGIAETSRPTTHAEPMYEEEGVVHYSVSNMPGACALTATQALTNATFTCARELANKGYRAALKENHHLMNGLNLWKGNVTNLYVAEDLGYNYVSPVDLF